MRYASPKIMQQLHLFLDDVRTLWLACIYEYGVYGASHSPWCTLFPENVTRILEYYEDLEYYWQDGYGHDVNYQQACVLFNDVIAYFALVHYVYYIHIIV